MVKEEEEDGQWEAGGGGATQEGGEEDARRPGEDGVEEAGENLVAVAGLLVATQHQPQAELLLLSTSSQSRQAHTDVLL